MSPEVTQAVLKDVLLATEVALVLGLLMYQLIRARTGQDWSRDGNVLSRPYGILDGVMALLLVALLTWSGDGSVEVEAEEVGLDGFVQSMFSNSMFMMMTVLLLGGYLRMRGMNPVEMFGLRAVSLRRSLWLAGIWLFGVLVVMNIAVVIGHAVLFGDQVPDESQQEVIEKFRLMETWGQRGIVILAAVVFAPLGEEVIFRGFLYGVAKRYSDRWFAALVTGLIFAVGHQHVGSLFPLFVLGVGFALAYEFSGSLLVPVFMHMMFNGINVVRIMMEGS